MVTSEELEQLAQSVAMCTAFPARDRLLLVDALRELAEQRREGAATTR